MLSGLNMNSDQFMKLFLTQLQQQNPMNPVDNSKMVSQISQLTTVETMNSMKSSFEDVFRLVSLTGGTSLIGREVRYRQGQEIKSGTVDSLKASDGAVKLRCGEDTVDLSNVQKVL